MRKVFAKRKENGFEVKIWGDAGVSHYYPVQTEIELLTIFIESLGVSESVARTYVADLKEKGYFETQVR